MTITVTADSARGQRSQGRSVELPSVTLSPNRPRLMQGAKVWRKILAANRGLEVILTRAS
jgi:hypothetical protein